jgi:hypothetical protein
MILEKIGSHNFHKFKFNHFYFSICFFSLIIAAPCEVSNKTKPYIAKKEKHMTDNSKNNGQTDFWTSPLKPYLDVASQLVEDQKVGLFLAVPPYIQADKHDEFPFDIIRVAPSTEAVVFNLLYSAFIIAVDCQTNQTYIGKAFQRNYIKIPRDPDEPPPPPELWPDGCHGDLLKLLAMPHEPGRYSVTAACGGRLSTSAIVDVGTEELRKNPEAFNKILEKKALSKPALSISPKPGTPLPSYEKTEHSPAIDPEKHLILSAPAKISLRTSRQIPVYGCFSIPVVNAHKDIENHQSDTPAILPIALVATGSTENGPFLWRINVPVKTAANSAATAEGYFSLDLATLGHNFQKNAQTLYLSAFCGEYKSEVITIVVDDK